MNHLPYHIIVVEPAPQRLEAPSFRRARREVQRLLQEGAERGMILRARDRRELQHFRRHPSCHQDAPVGESRPPTGVP
jgi:hypothetical protein